MAEQTDIVLEDHVIEVVGDVTLHRRSDGERTIRFETEYGNLKLGGNGHDGDVMVHDASGNRTIHADGQHGNVTLGGSGHDGDLVLRAHDGENTVHLDGQVGNVTLGGNGHDGDVVVRDDASETRVHLDGGSGPVGQSVRVHADGRTGELRLGGDGEDGELSVTDVASADRIHLNGGGKAVVHTTDGGATTYESRSSLGALTSPISAEVSTQPARLSVLDEAVIRDDASYDIPDFEIDIDEVGLPDSIRIYAEGDAGSLVLGGDGVAGDLVVGDEDDVARIRLDGEGRPLFGSVRTYIDGKHGAIRLGGDGEDGGFEVRNAADEPTLSVDGARGDLSLGDIGSLLDHLATLEARIEDLETAETTPAGGD